MKLKYKTVSDYDSPIHALFISTSILLRNI